MPYLKLAKNQIWYKYSPESEQERERNILLATDHATGKTNPHHISSIVGANVLDNKIKYLEQSLVNIRQDVSQAGADRLSELESSIRQLETKLFYSVWLSKNGSYDYLEFDDFHDDSKLFHSYIVDQKLVPEPDKNNDFSIYKTIAFFPALKQPISRYQVHIEYKVFDQGGLIVEISFDEGQSYHSVLNTVPDPSIPSYYQYPSFCDIDNAVPELNADSFLLRFRLLANKSGSGVEVSSYGVIVS